jgi:DNA repair exonuclease SbcCD nuclease subunit
MKIALITDTHAGMRNDNADYSNYAGRFFKNIFFPYLKEHDIKTVIHLGDVFDRRKYINFNTLNAFHEQWTTPVIEQGIEVHSILGNHDVYYRNTNDINAQNLLLQQANTTVYEKPETIEIGGLKIAMLPWINRDNYDESMQFIKDTEAPVLMGHLELNGYQVLKNVKFAHGMDPAGFAKFSRVFSGHFHVKQQKGNIDYLGTPYEITFNDAGLKKGFHIFDTETRSLEFIQNPEKMHIYLPYDDTEVDYLTADISDYAGKVVKVNVIEKNDSYVFEKFIERLDAVAPIKYTIIDNTEVLDYGTTEEGLESKDTMSILVDYVNDNFESDEDKKEITKLMRELYNEAISES